MVWIAMVIISWFAFIRQFWLLHLYAPYQSRRNLSCCEMARQFLDKSGFPQVPVQSASLWDCFRLGVDKQLLLENNIYGSRTLYAAAQTAQGVAALNKSSGAIIPVSWMFRIRTVLRILLIPAWLFFGLGFLNPQTAVLGMLGQVVLQVTLILGVFEFSRDWETSQDAAGLLKKSEIFETDEIVKLRALLSALKWRGLAEIFKVPFDVFTGLLRKRGHYGV